MDNSSWEGISSFDLVAWIRMSYRVETNPPETPEKPNSTQCR